MIFIKRPILVAVIGYIVGILWGLYFEISIVSFYVIIAVGYLLIKRIQKKKGKKKNKFELMSLKRYYRYIKLVFKSNIICFIVIISIISNTIVIFQNKKYNYLHRYDKTVKVTGVVVSNKKEKEYKDIYKLKVVKTENSNKFEHTYVYVELNKKDSNNIQFGDKVEIEGECVKVQEQRNYGGFDYSKYLKTIKVHGIVTVDSIKILSRNSINPIWRISNYISIKIKNDIRKIMDESSANVFQGLILGDTSQIDKQLQENFRISSIAHVLAISGMHISYVIIGINILTKKVIGKQKTKIIIIVILIMYMCITGFSPSVVRAGLMGILVTYANFIHRKNDIWNAIAISLFLILIYNPFLIMNIGLQLSYLGTIGIVVFHNNVLQILKNVRIKNKKIKYKSNLKRLLIIEKVKEILAIIISAQIVILPIILYNFNMFGPYFFISNILVSIIIGPIIIAGFICIIIASLNIQFSNIIANIISIGIKILICISNISKWPFAKMYFQTPKVYFIIFYYICIIIFNCLYSVFNSQNQSVTQIRVRNLVALAKYKFNQNKRKYIKSFCIFVSMTVFVISIIEISQRNLKIHFLDVGQGDCTFIELPNKKNILIDGGGSLSNEFDIGKNTLIPYILDRGYTKIDYVLISHFDQDHVRTEFLLLWKN